MDKKTLIKTLWILLLISVTGCRLGPKYHPPSVEVPEEWKNLAGQPPDLPPVCHWWEVFQDERLNGLEDQVVTNNPDLFMAMARIDEALAVAGIRRADLYPQLNFTPTSRDFSFKSKIRFSQPIKTAFPTLATLPTDRHWHLSIYNIPLFLNYELDLWGKYRSAYDAALKNAEAQQQAYEVALLTLTSSLASDYFNLRTLDATIDFLAGILETRRKNLQLSLSRFEKGLINYLNVTNDEVALRNTEADYEEAVGLRGLQENMIAALIGIPASDFHLEHIPLEDPPPNIPPGIPSTVLLRRPDLAEAERQRASEHALIGAAYASFFPSIELTGACGIFNFNLRKLVHLTTRYLEGAAAADQTIFDGFRKFENYEASWARFWEADSHYKKLVLTAFREVEDALDNIESQTKQSDSLKISFEVSTQTTRLARHRYDEGLVNYIEVIDNERTELDAGLRYYTILGLRYQSTVQLIKALGGGWDENAMPVVCE